MLLGTHNRWRTVDKSKQAEKIASISSTVSETNKEPKYDPERHCNDQILAEASAKCSEDAARSSSASLDEDSNVPAVEVCRCGNIYHIARPSVLL